MNYRIHSLALICEGRRRELIIAAVLYALGGLMTAYAPGLGILLIARLLYGIGIGLVSFLKLPIGVSSRVS